MPFGIGVGQVVGLVKEARSLEATSGRIAVSGPGAGDLAAALAAGGDRSAVSVDGDPSAAAVAVRFVEGAPSPSDAAVLRRLSRAGTPLIVVRRGGAEKIPYVLPGDVLDVDGEPPVAEIVAVIARVAGPAGPALAARLPVLRPAVAQRLIVTTSLANAAIAASPWIKQAQFPLLTLAQSRMLLLLGQSGGDVLPRDPKKLVRAAAPADGGSVAVGLGARELVRRSPFRGPLVRAAVAYAGTRVLGAAHLRL